MQTYSNTIVLALEGFPSFPVNLGQLFAFTTVRTGFSQAGNDLRNHFLFAMNAARV
jgi:hypothetical protein